MTAEIKDDQISKHEDDIVEDMKSTLAAADEYFDLISYGRDGSDLIAQVYDEDDNGKIAAEYRVIISIERL